MKKIYSIIFLAVVTMTAIAQTKPNRMTVNMKDGSATTYVIADVDSISFSYVNDDPSPDPVTRTTYQIIAPTSFAGGSVVKVMANGKQVAEIDYEYIKSKSSRKVVIYPMADNGKADLTKGVSLSDGGSVVWNTSNNTVEYTEGDGALEVVYLENGEIVTTATGEFTQTTFETDLIVDKRGSEEKSYKIVKIGTQYWMAENLATAFYADGTSIPLYKNDQTEAWKALKSGACHIILDNAENISSIHGYMYNGYAVMDGKGLAPKGWEIPSYQQWLTLRAYGGSQAVNYKSTAENSWLDNMDKNTDITGFTALPGGYFSPVNGDTNEGSEIYWWSSTSKYDFLTRENAIVPARITGTGTNFVVSDMSLHDYSYGHYVRCVRK